jgi:CHAT domain-containing protein
VIIIPDGILFNLSFEMLTPEKIASFKEFHTNSLLSKYSISYQYSLFLLQHNREKKQIKEKFVAFAPGFSDRLKKEYKRVVTDSMDLDRNYLHLLPQPFSVNLAKNTIGMLGGNLFVEKESTEATFKQKAGKHEIIHIGTHAESDNQHPEFSRLIFAKNPDELSQDNSLYLPEIYNCDLTSNLTVLTACETGKPGYEDGEGMISLAHAFNFAGSESILMGLWKIDEKSSATIVGSFYRNLLAGLSKDEALRQAKLSYLQTARGSALDPAYWAGLVLMGNSEPIELKQVSSKGYWLAGGITLLGIMLLVGGKRLRKNRQKHL